MKNFFLLFLGIFALISFMVSSCKKSDGGNGGNPDVCAGVTISVTATPTDVVPCGSNGSILVSATGSTGFTYSISGGAYQASPVFSNLSAGVYTVSAKDQNGCTGSQTATVGTAAMGTQFSAVRSLINQRCSGGSCHLSGQSSGGYNFDNNCSIVSNWSLINLRCVSSSYMPPAPNAPLTTAEKAIITAWINGGHTFAN